MSQNKQIHCHPEERFLRRRISRVGRSFAALRMTAQQGFTLLELLIALFIFTLVAIIMTSALRSMVDNQSRIEKSTTRFAEIEMALLLLSRDMEQAIDRPIVLNNNAVQGAFIGTNNSAILTHAGLANPLGQLQRSTLQRVGYRLADGKLLRETWPVLDQGVPTEPDKRVLLTNVTELRFEYLDKTSRPQIRWPLGDKTGQAALPRAVRVFITLSDLGKIKQLYLIPVQQSEKNPTP